MLIARTTGMKLPAVIREINVFAMIGVASTAINYVGALAAQHLLGLGPLPAGIVGLRRCGRRLLFRQQPADVPPPGDARAAVRPVRGDLAGRAGDQSGRWSSFGTHALGWPLWKALIPVVLIVPAATFVMSKFWAFAETETAG